MKYESLVPTGALVIGAILGYLAGLQSGQPTATVALPSNYDPTRAVVADVLRAQQDKTEQCYKMMMKRLEDNQRLPSE